MGLSQLTTNNLQLAIAAHNCFYGKVAQSRRSFYNKR